MNNGGVCVFTVNKRGEAMVQALNMTAHLYSDLITHTSTELVSPLPVFART